MDIIDAIKKRASIRKYIGDPLDPNVIQQLLESARMAPSANNQQPWEFIWITDSAIRDQLFDVCRSSYGQMPYLKECSGIIAAVCNPTDNERWTKFNVALAMQNIVLTAVHLGLGTCFIGAFQPPEVGKILKVPNSHEVVALLTVGKPDESGKAKDRKPLHTLSYQDTYGQPLLK